MIGNEQIRKLYDRRAWVYDSLVRALSFGRDGAYRDRAVAILDFQPGDRVLDVGCGTGLNFSRLPGDAIGAEPSRGLLRVARRRTRQLVGSYSEALPFPDDTFDRLLSTYVVTTVPRWQHALRELVRVLAPGGRLVLTDDRLPPYWFLGPGPMFRKLWKHGWVDVHRDIAREMERGLDDVNVEYLHFRMIYLISGIKKNS